MLDDALRQPRKNFENLACLHASEPAAVGARHYPRPVAPATTDTFQSHDAVATCLRMSGKRDQFGEAIQGHPLAVKAMKLVGSLQENRAHG